MLKLSSTSSLVMLWAQNDCYQSKMSQDYLHQLDLQEGKAIYQQCREVWPYYDQVIKNRKFGVSTLIKKCYAENNPQQLVIAAAGFDALGIEVSQHYLDLKIFELDRENMDVKSDLFAKLSNNQNANIEFIEADLLDVPVLYDRLISHGWSPDESTLLIMEGISYYLPPESISNFVQTLSPDQIIFEYLKHNETIAADRQKIPQKVFNLISNQCDLPDIWRYNSADIETLLEMSTSAKYSMHTLEKIRTNKNRFFPTENAGWIDVALLEK